MSNIKSSVSYKRNFRGFFISFLTTLVILNVVYAWALPNVQVECMDDSGLVYFKNNDLAIPEDSKLTNTLNTMTDAIILICLALFTLVEGRKRFTYRVLLLLIFKYVMDILFYQKNIYRSSYDTDYTFSITNNMNKKDSSLFVLSISLLLECAREIFDGKKMVYKIGLVFHIITFLIYFWITSKFLTYQILFSFILNDYLNEYFF
jgi:hypothetical protein